MCILGNMRKGNFFTILMENDKLQLSSFPTFQISKWNVPKFSNHPGVVWGEEKGGEVKSIPEHQKRIHILEIQSSLYPLRAMWSLVMSLKPQCFHLSNEENNSYHTRLLHKLLFKQNYEGEHIW